MEKKDKKINDKIQFRYTNFYTVMMYLVVFTGSIFAICAFAWQQFETFLLFNYRISFRNGFWIPVIIVYIISMAAYSKCLYKFVERTGIAHICDNRIDLELGGLQRTILFTDMTNIEYKPYRGNWWYALVITTQKEKININESQIYAKKRDLNSPLFELFERLDATKNIQI